MPPKCYKTRGFFHSGPYKLYAGKPYNLYVLFLCKTPSNARFDKNHPYTLYGFLVDSHILSEYNKIRETDRRVRL